MTYRDRREARAARLDEWATKRQERAAAVFEANRPYTSDYAFNTQPGHIPARTRIIAQEDRAFESIRKAEDMASRADHIRDQLDASIYSDDPDAIDRLEERIAKLEAERESVKAHNKTHRNGKLCTCPPECDCRTRFPRSCTCKNHPLPSYVLTNLSGNIKRNRDRLEVLTRQAARAEEAQAAPSGVTVADQGSGYVSVTFADKPAIEVRDALKAAGFYWRQGSWWGKHDALPEDLS